MSLNIIDILSDIVGTVFEDQGLPSELGAVRFSDRPDLAEFQCNGAMAGAKKIGKNPRELAQSVVDQLIKNHSDLFETIEVAGPGFINLKLTHTAVAEQFLKLSDTDRFGAATLNNGDQTVVIDYGGYNVAKALHAGHMRPSNFGESIKRLYAFAGYRTLGDVHFGDWGLQMGQVISEYEIRHPEWVYFDPDYTGSYPEKAPFDFKELVEVYPQASKACKEDPRRLEKARQATVELQNKRPGYYAFWQHLLGESIRYCEVVCERLNIHFDLWKGESDTQDLIDPLQKLLEQKNILEESDGAHVIHVKRDDDKEEIPPLMYLKGDGGVTYGTTDMATIWDRVRTYPNLAKIVYVVDQRQALHFNQLFRASDKADLFPSENMSFLGFGTLNGPDKKPFKTRDGGLKTLSALIDDVEEKVRQKMVDANLAEDISNAEKQDIVNKVAVAAIKYADLSNQIHQNIVFDIDKMTQFEGQTGPYVLYQSVRIQSLLNKYSKEISVDDYKANDFTTAERALILKLLAWPQAFHQTFAAQSPHILCEYLMGVAQVFAKFYAQHNILKEQDIQQQKNWIYLCQQTRNVLGIGLDLLGIDIPKRM